jgi:hypothetical protein
MLVIYFRPRDDVNRRNKRRRKSLSGQKNLLRRQKKYGLSLPDHGRPALRGDIGCHTGDKLRIIHHLLVGHVPASYLKALFASRLAGRYVYEFGLDANEIHFYNFLQEFKKNPVAQKLANGPIS